MLEVNDFVVVIGYYGDTWINGEFKRLRIGDVGVVMKLGEGGLFPTVYVYWYNGELNCEEAEVLENGLEKISFKELIARLS